MQGSRPASTVEIQPPNGWGNYEGALEFLEATDAAPLSLAPRDLCEDNVSLILSETELATLLAVAILANAMRDYDAAKAAHRATTEEYSECKKALDICARGVIDAEGA